jgi:predicted regulator of Ras-like GTPase activity (Roadblock/LC7/MglB family)
MKSENMEDDIYSFALRNTLHEITNACPDISNIFLFNKDGGIITGEENVRQAAVSTIDALRDVLEKAETLGGVQNIIVEGTRGTVSVSLINDSYLVTVLPEGADLKYVNTLADVLVRTITKLLEKTNLALNRGSPRGPEEPTIIPDTKPTETSFEETVKKYEEQAPSAASPDRIGPEPQVNQFIVDKTEGMFASSDTVRIDGETLSQWMELYEKKKIEEVVIETFGGKSVQCKLKPIKGSKYEGKGIIQVPEKIQKSLEVKKGELVRVKPIIE